MCKVFRVYFSTPPGATPTDDYLVDHSFVPFHPIKSSALTCLHWLTSLPRNLLIRSIYFYLMDPDGAFVEAFGKEVPAHDVYTKFQEFYKDYQEDAEIAKRLTQEELLREGRKA